MGLLEKKAGICLTVGKRKKNKNFSLFLHFLLALIIETCIIKSMGNNTVTENELDNIIGKEHHKSVYHANHLINDKIVDKSSFLFGKKGESYYLKNGNQWYFKPKMKVKEYAKNSEGVEVETGKMVDNKEFFRVKWYQLDSSVGEGDYGRAKYVGINGSIYGKVGKLLYRSKKWIFEFDGEVYKLNSPESVPLLD